MKKIRKNQSGFTLAELLVTVSLIIVLISLFGVSYNKISANLRQKELDAKAEIIYTAAQNKLIKMKAGANTEILSFNSSIYPNNKVKQVPGIPTDASIEDNIEAGDILYVTSKDLLGSEFEDTAIYALVGNKTLDENIAANNYVIEYNNKSGTIYSVYYSESRADCAQEYENNYTQYDYNLRNKTGRLLYGAKVGYYGGGSAVQSEVTNITPVLEIINAEKLAANVVCTTPTSVSEYPAFKVEISDTYGNKYTEYHALDTLSGSGDADYLKKLEKIAQGNPISFDLKRTGRTVSLNMILDDLAFDDSRFSAKFPTLKAGSDIKMIVTVLVPGNFLVSSNLSDTKTTNSLFASIDGTTANISYARHLQNLDSTSNVMPEITTAKFISDVSCKDSELKEGIYDFFETYNRNYFNGIAHQSANFKPIQNPNINTLDGANFQLIGLNMSTGNNPGGLFGNVSYSLDITNLKLVGTTIRSNAFTGSLVGSTSNGAQIRIEKAQNYLSGEFIKNKTNHDTYMSGKDVGGLVGIVNGGNVLINQSSSSTIIGDHTFSDVSKTIASYAAQNVGGLVGSVNSGILTITNSYADNYMVGKNVGGLIGKSNVNSNISSSYCAGYASFDLAGYGIAERANVKNSYTVLSKLYTGDTVAYYSTIESGSKDNVYYQIQSTNYTNDSNSIQIGNISIDEFKNNLNSSVFITNTSDSVPYNLNGQTLTTYVYPVISKLKHFGDWEAGFQSGALVYYEKYNDGDESYGFYGANVASTLKNSANLTVVGDGYGLVYEEADYQNIPSKVSLKIQNGSTVTYDQELNLDEDNFLSVQNGDKTYWVYPFEKELVNPTKGPDKFYYKATIKSTSGTDDAWSKTDTYFFNPQFAKTVIFLTDVDASEPDLVEGGNISIRTPRHLNNLAEFYGSNYSGNLTQKSIFLQERNIDYALYDWSNFSTKGKITNQKPIGYYSGGNKDFISTYDGQGNWISDVDILSDGNYVGLFAKNEGIIKNVVLRATYQEGSNKNHYVARNSTQNENQEIYIGVFVGLNGTKGNIVNCAISGYSLAGADGSIYAYKDSTISAGGFVGGNLGTIRNSESNTPITRLSTTYANVYLGGFVGNNAGTINNSYSLGVIEVVFTKGGKVEVGGFVAKNSSYISSSYSISAISAGGSSTTVYGFAPFGGTVSNCEYLNDGTYSYLGKMYSFNYENGVGISRSLPYLKQYAQDNNLRPLYSYDFSNTTTISGMYPLKAVVRDKDNNLVHYGDWIDEEKMGSVGVFYWEHEEKGSNNGYHFTYLGVSEDGVAFGNTNLCNSHDDGGVITEYGYGFFEEKEGSISSVLVENGYINGSTIFDSTNSNKIFNTIASQELTKQLPVGTDPNGDTKYKYNFYAFTTRTYSDTSSDKTGITLSNTKANSTWKLITTEGKEYKYNISPFFANALSDNNGNTVYITSNDRNTYNYSSSVVLGASNKNPYEIRSVEQLQNINYNGKTHTVNELVEANKDNYKYFNYLASTSAPNPKGQYKQTRSNALNSTYYNFVQTHDLNGDGYMFTPIAGDYNPVPVNDTSYSRPFYTWFGGSYDGRSYKIQNINIESKSFTVGLFGSTLGANLENIILHGDGDSFIKRKTESTSDNSNRGGYSLGGLVGVAYNYGTVSNNIFRTDEGEEALIKNCSISGYQVIDDSHNHQSRGESNVGGLVGVSAISFENCSAVVDIKIQATNIDNVDTWLRVGGLAGASQGTIRNCYTGGSISATHEALTWNNAQHKNQYTYIGGIAGSSFTFNYSNITNGDGRAADASISFENCYTYMKLPKMEWNIAGIAIMGSQADRYGASSDLKVTIKNCYYLDGIVESESNNNKGPAAISTKLSDIPVWKTESQNTPFENDTLYEAMLKGNMAYYSISYNRGLNDQFKAHSVMSKTVLGDGLTDKGLTKLSYEQMSSSAQTIHIGNNDYNFVDALNLFGTGSFEWVTTREGSALIDGKYSFPIMSSLEGKNYPFATIITQKDFAYDRQVFVHYGDWPIAGPYWAEGRSSFEIFKNMDIDGYSKKAFTLFTNGFNGDVTFDSSNSNIAVIDSYNKNANGNYEVVVKAIDVGNCDILASYGNQNTSFALNISVDLSLVPQSTNFKVGLGQTETIQVDVKAGNNLLPNLDIEKWTYKNNQSTNSNLLDIKIKDDETNKFEIKRVALGEEHITLTYTYNYNGKDIKASAVLIVGQEDYVGLDTTNDTPSIRYLGSLLSSPVAPVYSGNEPNVLNSNYFVFIDAQNYSVRDISNIKYYINNREAKLFDVSNDTENKRLYIGEYITDNGYHIKLNDLSNDDTFSYMSGTVYGVSDNPDFAKSGLNIQVKFNLYGKEVELTRNLPVIDVYKEIKVTYHNGSGKDANYYVLSGNRKLLSQDEAASISGFVPAGKMFSRWQNNSIDYLAGQSYDFETDTEFVANYVDKTYTLHASGGTFVVNGQEVNDGKIQVANLNDKKLSDFYSSITRAGYFLAGFGISDNGEVIYSPKEVINATSLESYDLYAIWTQKPKITLYDGHNSIYSKSINENSTSLQDYIKPERFNWNLDGFYTGNSLSSIGKKVLNADGTFVAGVEGYTNAQGEYIRDEYSINLYAMYTQPRSYMYLPVIECSRMDTGEDDYYLIVHGDKVFGNPAANPNNVRINISQSTTGTIFAGDKVVEEYIDASDVTGTYMIYLFVDNDNSGKTWAYNLGGNKQLYVGNDTRTNLNGTRFNFYTRGLPTSDIPLFSGNATGGTAIKYSYDGEYLLCEPQVRDTTYGDYNLKIGYNTKNNQFDARRTNETGDTMTDFEGVKLYKIARNIVERSFDPE